MSKRKSKGVLNFRIFALLFLFLFSASIAMGQTPLLKPVYIYLGDLANISPTANSPTDNHVLKYDAATELWGPEAEAGGADVKVAIDAAATADYFGVAFNDGMFRWTQNHFTMADGGDFVTFSLADHATARTALGLAIGSDVLAYDAGLSNLAGVAMVADRFYYTSADNVHVAAAVTAYARSILDDANEVTFKATVNLEIGTDILAEQTIGIADNNLMEVDHAAAADDDYAKFTANGLEGRSYAELLADLSTQAGAAFDWGGQNIIKISSAFLTEQAAAQADVAGDGQIWVKNTTPNELWFTDDAGADVQLGIAGSDEKVKVDVAAAAGYLGVAAGDGVLRTSNSIGWTDGGDFVTLDVTEANVDHDALSNFVTNEHINWEDAAGVAQNFGTSGYVALHYNAEVRFYDNGNYVGFEAPALGANQIWVLPSADGAAGHQLTTNAAGGLSWAAPGAGTVDTAGVPVANDFARFTDLDTIEGRSYSETLDDLSAQAGAAFSWNSQGLTAVAAIAGPAAALDINTNVVQDVNFWDTIASGNPSINIFGWNTAGGDRESFSLSMSDTNDEAVLTIPNSVNNEGFTVALSETNQAFRIRQNSDILKIYLDGTDVIFDFSDSGSFIFQSTAVTASSLVMEEADANGVNTLTQTVGNLTESYTWTYPVASGSTGQVPYDTDGAATMGWKTVGIADNNLMEVDHAAAADNDYAKFTANGLEGRSYAEVMGDLPAATTGAAGKSELATTAETSAGTDTTRAVTADGLAGSTLGRKTMVWKIMAHDTVVTSGDGKDYFTIPVDLNGWDLVAVGAHVYTVDAANAITIDIYNFTDSADMLSTAITIDANEKDSATAAVPPVINGAADDVATADEIRGDVTTYAGAAAKGLEIRLTFEKQV